MTIPIDFDETGKPFVRYKNEKFFLIGCTVCRTPTWICAASKDKKQIIGICFNCGHTTIINSQQLTIKPITANDRFTKELNNNLKKGA